MNYAYPVMTRRGLCNLLFTWAQAESYCHKTGAKMIEPNWTSGMRLGPWIRGERYKRYYGGLFNSNGHVSGIYKLLLLLFCRNKVEKFRGMEGFFDSFIDDQPHITEALWQMTRRGIALAVEKSLTEPFIAVHIRRGDFKQAGHVVEDKWFVSATREALGISGLQSENGFVRVFTDGYPEEVLFLQRAFPSLKIKIQDKASPMFDLLLMSKAKVLVGSAKSTFSMWPVFLGQMPSIWEKCCVDSLPRLYCGGEHKALFI